MPEAKDGDEIAILLLLDLIILKFYTNLESSITGLLVIRGNLRYLTVAAVSRLCSSGRMRFNKLLVWFLHQTDAFH